MSGEQIDAKSCRFLGITTSRIWIQHLVRGPAQQQTKLNLAGVGQLISATNRQDGGQIFVKYTLPMHEAHAALIECVDCRLAIVFTGKQATELTLRVEHNSHELQV